MKGRERGEEGKRGISYIPVAGYLEHFRAQCYIDKSFVSKL